MLGCLPTLKFFQLRSDERMVRYRRTMGLSPCPLGLCMSSLSSQSEISMVSILIFFLILALVFSALPLNLHRVHCLKHSFFEFVANISIDSAFLHLLQVLLIASIDTKITNYPFRTFHTLHSYVLLTSVEVNKIYNFHFLKRLVPLVLRIASSSSPSCS
jgi:hypothetical protein